MTTLSSSKQTIPEESAVENSAKKAARPYINPYLAGILLGGVLFMAFFLTGSGLGASGGLNRMLVFVLSLERNS